MITYLIPTYSNPEGLALTIASIRSHAYLSDVEVIVLLESGDVFLNDGLEVCKRDYSPMIVRHIVYQSPSLSAKVNHSAMCANNPFVTVVNDGIILSSFSSNVEGVCRSVVETFKDSLAVLYPSIPPSHASAPRCPIVSKKFVELTGYLYFPMCVGFNMSEMWLGSIFFDLERGVEVDTIAIQCNKDNPCKIGTDPEAKREAEILYSNTGKIRRYTANMLRNFML